MKHVSYYKEEYPRPQLWRESYTILNGKWDFAFGDDCTDEQMKSGFVDKMTINVPFTYQTAASGIGTEVRHDVEQAPSRQEAREPLPLSLQIHD